MNGMWPFNKNPPIVLTVLPRTNPEVFTYEFGQNTITEPKELSEWCSHYKGKIKWPIPERFSSVYPNYPKPVVIFKNHKDAVMFKLVFSEDYIIESVN